MVPGEPPSSQDLETETRSATDVQAQLKELSVVCLTVLSHPDPTRVGDRASLTALISGGEEKLSRREPAFSGEPPATPQPLGHRRLSRKPLLITGTGEGAVTLDPAGTSMEVVVDGEPLDGIRTLSKQQLQRGVVLLLGNRVVLLLHLTDLLSAKSPANRHGMVGQSAAMLRLYQEIERVADLDFAVLLRGESGTGKEMVARAIHESSPRQRQPYLAVNIAAIPQTLATSELFGATKGAYSGADRKRQGYFQRAHGGTLFLDEIGEAPAEVQVLLLRALESGEIQPVGADSVATVDVRVVSATDANLEDAVSEDRFRAPLFHRLSAYEIHLPALRERREDFGRLFYHFLREELEAVGAADHLDPARERSWVSAELVSRLVQFEWPGNVRQLRNVVRQLVIGNRDTDTMELVPAVARLLEDGGSTEEVSPAAPTTTTTPREASAEKRYRQSWEIPTAELVEMLKSEGWNINRTAERLNVSRTTLYKLIDACPEIRKASDLSEDELAAGLSEHGGNIEAMANALQVSPRGLQLRIKKLGVKVE